MAAVHLHNGILLGHKKERNLTFCDSVNGPREYHSKYYTRHKPVRERQIPCDFTYIWNLIKKKNRNKLIDAKTRLTAISGVGGWGAG